LVLRLGDRVTLQRSLVIGMTGTPQSVGVFAVAVRRLRPVEGVIAVIFGSVNQVLVRLCACRGQPSLTGCVHV
jgi:hypothetical protein